MLHFAQLAFLLNGQAGGTSGQGHEPTNECTTLEGRERILNAVSIRTVQVRSPQIDMRPGQARPGLQKDG